MVIEWVDRRMTLIPSLSSSFLPNNEYPRFILYTSPALMLRSKLEMFVSQPLISQIGTSRPYFGDLVLLLFVLVGLPQLGHCPTDNYELPTHIESFSDIKLSLDLNQPLLSLYQRLFVV